MKRNARKIHHNSIECSTSTAAEDCLAEECAAEDCEAMRTRAELIGA